MKNKFNYPEKALNDFKVSLDTYGWVVYENAIESDFINRINNDIEDGYIRRKSIQERNGISANMDGIHYHLLDRDNFSIPLLERMYCNEEITQYFGGKHILNGMNGAIYSKQECPYQNNMHRDASTFISKTKLLLQMIITLDDFTLQNGAIYFLSGSHKTALKPDEEFFYTHADSVVTPKGSIILFNSNLWYANGENVTPEPRRALILGFTQPFLKQQMDYSRFLGYDFVAGLKPELRQIIGYNACIPANLSDYYQPPHLRMYKHDQS
ncbi:phytanoyl-CoA dioxygenase family protein [Mucilaginibacter sp.]|uniref:phytanoyl-CoA dioxygenase family protein n=1 Tax=Mucilaginibacter sp. TaxID=1882438 RepID=UPI00261529E6|nr:phytanoyl-CoA dioxygenase family protein [Mucilaginibacter sp.]MDB5029399.1 Ectoine hydroxylase-related dioxygenase, phytanoyl-CoA dioxygenase (PhyH) family [Mucilaginibacter sp.]